MKTTIVAFVSSNLNLYADNVFLTNILLIFQLTQHVREREGGGDKGGREGYWDI